MTEVLGGSDWLTLSVVSQEGSTYLVRVLRRGQPIFVGWSDGALTPVTVSDLSTSSVRVTAAVPHFATGQAVVDYASAFEVADPPVSGGKVEISLSQNPVFVEPR